MNRKQKGDLTHVADVLRKAVAACRPAGDMGMLRVWEIWDDAVGETIAANARPAAFKGGLLLVRVNSSVWMQHLGFQKKELMDNLNKNLGGDMVRDIRFKIGALDGASREGSHE